MVVIHKLGEFLRGQPRHNTKAMGPSAPKFLGTPLSPRAQSSNKISIVRDDATVLVKIVIAHP